jgi:hypothetical protein
VEETFEDPIIAKLTVARECRDTRALPPHTRRRLHSTLGYVSPETCEKGTLVKEGTGLATSRLAHFTRDDPIQG